MFNTYIKIHYELNGMQPWKHGNLINIERNISPCTSSSSEGKLSGICYIVVLIVGEINTQKKKLHDKITYTKKLLSTHRIKNLHYLLIIHLMFNFLWTCNYFTKNELRLLANNYDYTTNLQNCTNIHEMKGNLFYHRQIYEDLKKISFKNWYRFTVSPDTTFKTLDNELLRKTVCPFIGWNGS